ncbi:MAG: DUF481 domain-containing protein [Myxococcota bacterium]
MFAWILGAMAMAQTTIPAAEIPADNDEVEAEVDKSVTTLGAELGFTYVSGNAVLVALNGGLQFSHRWKRNRFQLPATLNVGQSIPDTDGSGTLDDTERAAGLTENARRIIVEPRYDRFFSDKDSLFIVVGVLHDPFIGYDLRPHQAIGYSRLLVDDDDTEVRVEIGFDYAQEFYVEGIDPDFQSIFAARAQGVFRQQFNDNVGFSDTIEVFENLLDPADLRLINTATLTSSLSSKLSLKLSHQLLFDNVPVEGFRKTDQTSMVTLVATLL